MEIILNTIDTAAITAEMVTKKVSELIKSSEEFTRINLSLDLNRIEFIDAEIKGVYSTYTQISLRYVLNKEDVATASYYIPRYDGTEEALVRAVDKFLTTVSARLAEMKRAEDFKLKCYEAYQLDWMLSHGISLDGLFKAFYECLMEEYDTNLKLEEHMFLSKSDIKKLMEGARALLDETGFGQGTMYVCMDEFLESEFLDPDYMAHLLDAMPGTENPRKTWVNITGLTLSEEAAV